jgi:hypothetical protein
LTSDSEEETAGADFFLNEIEEMNGFKEKNLDNEDGMKYTNK